MLLSTLKQFFQMVYLHVFVDTEIVFQIVLLHVVVDTTAVLQVVLLHVFIDSESETVLKIV